MKAIPSDELEAMMEPTQEAMITIATKSLVVGIDVDGFECSIKVNIPQGETIDDLIQEIGRLNRGRSIPVVCFVIYIPPSSRKRAEEVIENAGQPPKRKGKGGGGKEVMVIDDSIVYLLMAKCITEQINRQYEKPTDDPRCTCEGCRQSIFSPSPIDAHCHCSSCVPCKAISKCYRPPTT